MPPEPVASGAWTYLAPLMVLGVAALRTLRPRKLRIERMWIMPVLILLAVALSLRAQGPQDIQLMIAEAFAFGLGGGVGWWRGRTTNIMIDPGTHDLSSRASPIGLALIAGLVLIRFALRNYADGHLHELHVTPVQVADVFLLFAAGLICVQRLEMWLRARRLLRAARASS